MDKNLEDMEALLEDAEKEGDVAKIEAILWEAVVSHLPPTYKGCLDIAHAYHRFLRLHEGDKMTRLRKRIIWSLIIRAEELSQFFDILDCELFHFFGRDPYKWNERDTFGDTIGTATTELIQSCFMGLLDYIKKFPDAIEAIERVPEHQTTIPSPSDFFWSCIYEKYLEKAAALVTNADEFTKLCSYLTSGNEVHDRIRKQAEEVISTTTAC